MDNKIIEKPKPKYYNEKVKIANLKYQAKKRQELKDGLITHVSFGHASDAARARSNKKNKEKQYIENTVCLIHRLFKEK